MRLSGSATLVMAAAGAASLALGLSAMAAPGGHRLRSGETWRPARAVDAPGVNGALLISGEVSGAKVGPVKVNGAYRAIETLKDAVVRDLEIEGVTGVDLERDGIRLQGDVDGVTIADFKLRMADKPQVGSHLPEGIAILTGRNITIRDGSVGGFKMERVEKQYTNGDGVAAEWKVSGLRIERVEASDNSDAGFDLKSRDTWLDELTAKRNGRNYRVWREIQAGTLTSEDPRAAHIWVGRSGVVRIEKLVARSRTSAPILLLDGAREVEIGRCELDVPPNTIMVRGRNPETVLKLGPGCEDGEAVGKRKK